MRQVSLLAFFGKTKFLFYFFYRKTETGTVHSTSTPQRTNNPPPPRPDAHTSSSSSSSHHNREKRHSFTSLTPPQRHSNTAHNRHSAEILTPDNEIQQQSQKPSTQTNERERTRKTDLTNALQLPAAYIALYAYKPQKADELELRKGGIYMVTERCQDGWFKGTSNRTQKCGVFPGNYVTLARGAPKSPQHASESNEPKTSYTRNGRSTISKQLPPELPPRSGSPANTTNTISSSWHGQQDNAAAPLGRSSSAIMSGLNTQLNVATAKPVVEKVRV